MRRSTYLVFGDLHGHVLPAFKLAQAWSREHGVALDGLLQVGDLADRPEPSGVDLVTQPSDEADEVFAGAPCPGKMFFTAGNHDDYDLLEECERTAARDAASFAADAYGRLRCVRDGRVAELPGGLRVGALWGIDGDGPRARRKAPARARVRRRAATALSIARFDVLLTHESPRDALLAEHGSEDIGAVIHRAQPAFAFFGHYHRAGGPAEGDFGATRVYHVGHLGLRPRVEEGSVGVLTWGGDGGEFAYLDPAWLRTVTRSNWKHR